LKVLGLNRLAYDLRMLFAKFLCCIQLNDHPFIETIINRII